MYLIKMYIVVMIRRTDEHFLSSEVERLCGCLSASILLQLLLTQSELLGGARGADDGRYAADGVLMSSSDCLRRGRHALLIRRNDTSVTHRLEPAAR